MTLLHLWVFVACYRVKFTFILTYNYERFQACTALLLGRPIIWDATRFRLVTTNTPQCPTSRKSQLRINLSYSRKESGLYLILAQNVIFVFYRHQLYRQDRCYA
jgi:hypothetical protein